MNAQGLAWAWLKARPTRPFAFLGSPVPGKQERFTLLAGEPLFVFEAWGAKARVVVDGRPFASRKAPERVFADLGAALARRRGAPAFWPLLHALSYEAGRRFEALPAPQAEPLGLPDWWAFLPGAWLLEGRGAKGWKAASADLSPSLARALSGALGIPASALRLTPRAAERAAFLKRLLALRPRAAAPAFRGLPRPAIHSDPGQGAYEARVRRIQAHIRAGDIYQANLSQRRSAAYRAEPFEAYRRLTAQNPAPMAAYVDLGPAQVLCASPERFLRLKGRRAEAWPIAGTAANTGRPGERAALRRSIKDGAEHVMLVDLLRNDLGRVSVGGGVSVPRFKRVQSHPHVHHLVSQVLGRLKPGIGLPELYQAAFPGGSITGAPKIRCMQVITALERRARGWYTGCLGWWEPRRAEADVAILIRTVYLKGGRATWQVGAGIVADSDPAKEWRETLAKAKGLERALFRGRRG